MTRWREVTLAEVCNSIDDGDWIETKDQGGSDYRLLQVSNIGVGHFRETGKYRYVTQETFDRLRCHEIRPGMVLVARMPDPVGRAWYVDRLLEPAITAVDVAIVDPDPTQLDGRFCAYLLNSPQQLAHAAAVAGGTTRLRITRKQLAAFQLRLPDLPYQRAVARVLAHFDDLIENNRRRIELLEEMARAIYREWFVHFRYPGHEDVPLVDSPLGSIPDGWRAGRVDDLVTLSKVTVDPATVDPSTPAVGLEHIPRRQITLGEWGAAADLGSRKSTFDVGDVLFGKIRPYFHKVSVAPIEGICSTDAIVLRPDAVHWGQAVLALASDEFVAHAVQTSNGTKMPRADWKVIREFPVAVPPPEVAHEFSEVARRLLDHARSLMLQNRNLAALRDLLLPRLVTGQIDVSRLDLDELVEVASA